MHFFFSKRDTHTERYFFEGGRGKLERKICAESLHDAVIGQSKRNEELGEGGGGREVGEL